MATSSSPLRLLLSFGLPASPCLCHSFSLFLIFALPVCVLAKLSFAFRAAGALYCHCVSCVASQASASVRRTAHLKKKCSNECPLSELVRNRARTKARGSNLTPRNIEQRTPSSPSDPFGLKQLPSAQGSSPSRSTFYSSAPRAVASWVGYWIPVAWLGSLIHWFCSGLIRFDSDFI